MATLASLNINIGANSAALRKELTKAGQRVSNFAKNARSSMNTYGKAGVMAGALVIGSMLAVYKQQAAVIDQTAKFADSIGIQTEALTELHHAAGLSGVSNKELEKSLETMTRRVAEAANNGTGPLNETLEALKINVKDLNNLKPDQQLSLLADTLQGVESQSERTRIAYELFGRSGTGLLKMVESGSAGLASMREEAKLLGLSLDRIDANKVEMANDAVARAESVWGSFSQKLTTEAAPVIGSLAELFLENAKQAGGMGEYAAIAIETMVTGAGYVANAWRGIQVIWQGVKTSFNGLKLLVMQGLQLWVNTLTSVGEHIFKTIVSPMQLALEAAGYFNEDAAKMAVKLREISSFEAPELFDAAATQQAYKDAADSTAALHQLMMEPIPSQNLEQWYTQAKNRYEELAKTYTSGINYNAGEGEGQSGANNSGTQPANNPYASQIAAAQEYLLLKKTMEDNAWTEGQARLQLDLQSYGEGLASKVIADQEYYALVTQAHDEYLATKAAQDEAHQQNEKLRQTAQLQGASQLFEGLYGITAQFAGRQSGLYKAMFIASKAFSVAESIIKIQQGIANAASQAYPQNIIAMGSVIAATSSIVSTIKGTEIDGMAHDGIDYIPNEGTWLLNKGERVVDDRTNADLKQYLANKSNETAPASSKTEVSFNLQNITDSSLVSMIKANRNLIARILKSPLERPA